MKRYYIICRVVLMAILAVIGLTPAEARSKHHSSSHSSSAHRSSSKKSTSAHRSSGRKASSHRASNRHASSRRSSSRSSRSRGASFPRSTELPTETQPREALPSFGSTAPLDPNDAATVNGEPFMIDPMVQARDAMARGDPAEALGRYLRVLARDPGDLEALSGAGAAALAVGDADAAINFYVRAQKISPRDGRIKAGLGSALVQKEQPRAALKLFDDAIGLGVAPAMVALDRGLAYDLRGDNRRAQQEYALVARAGPNAEATRRMALSMAMGGDRIGALAILDPLLRQQDVPAWRARAFVLAMTGDAVGAEQAAYAVLPRSQADELKPFLERLPLLKPAEKAAAVHFGHFPEDKAPQLVDVSPVSSPKSAPVVATPVPPPVLAYAAPNFVLPPSTSGGRSGSSTPPAYVQATTTDQGNAAIEAAAAAAAAKARADARQRADDQRAAERRVALEKAAADRKVAAEKAASEKKAKDREAAKARASDPARYWVQIASGAYKPDLSKELAKQKSKWGKQLAGKVAWTVPYKATNRLLIGPFGSSDAAQDYVNDARKQGFSCLPVTTASGQKVERLD